MRYIDLFDSRNRDLYIYSLIIWENVDPIYKRTCGGSGMGSEHFYEPFKCTIFLIL